MVSKRATLALGAVVALCAWAGLDGSYVLPDDHQAIQYARRPVDDAVSRLQKRISSGGVKLTFDSTFGYLPSVLKELSAPEASQVLVFSKTSFQAPRIGPRMPRALYFNEEVSVGFVRGGDVVELAAHDPQQGIIFYTLDQERSANPRFERQDQCLQCHASGATLGVPGLVVRSVYADRHGMPNFTAGSFITDHRSPLDQRWGGWYVTGKQSGQPHLGNAIYADKESRNPGTGRPDVLDLKEFFDTGAYLRPTSDVVALMVLEHQTRMTNLLTRVNWETRMALFDSEVMQKALGDPPGVLSESCIRRINNATEELVKYMLFTDEALLKGTVEGTSGFAAEYQKGGVRDPKGRSLRELDLKTRLLKYPCSPMIYSRAFRALPAEARNRVLRRLDEVLTGKDNSAVFARLSANDRAAIREILVSTKVL